jgi:hypothetical protein
MFFFFPFLLSSSAGRTLMELSQEDLISIGITVLGQYKKILRERGGARVKKKTKTKKKNKEKKKRDFF